MQKNDLVEVISTLSRQLSQAEEKADSFTAIKNELDESRILISLFRDWNDKLGSELDIARDFIVNAISKGAKGGEWRPMEPVEAVYKKKIESYRAENQCLKSQLIVMKAQMESQ